MTDSGERKRGRPRKGELVPGAKGVYGGRVTVEIDGETVRKRVRLGTSDPQAARKKLGRLLTDDSALLAITAGSAGAETFEAAARRILGARTGVRAAKEFDRVERYAFAVHAESKDPVLAKKASLLWHGPVSLVTSADLAWVLEMTKQRGLSRQTVKHLKNALKYLFAALASPLEGAVKRDPMLEVTLPKMPREVKKTTEVLEDDELGVYLAWEHPVERFREAVYQRQMMSVVSRMYGGLRTWDLNLIRWDGFDIGERGDFVRGWAPREKAGVPQRLTVHAELRPFLRWWWLRNGKPREGLLFPALRGERVGNSREQPSHARAFRRDLQRAFGIERWNGERGRWEVARAMTERERALFLEARYTEPVDFHSWRRAYAQAVEAAASSSVGPGLSPVERGRLSGHADEATRQLYLRRYGKALVAPDGAMPLLGMGSTGIFGQVLAQNTREVDSATDDFESDDEELTGRARRDSNLRPTAPEADSTVANGRKPYVLVTRRVERSDEKTPADNEGGLKARPKNEQPTPALLDQLRASARAALEAEDWETLAALKPLIEAQTRRAKAAAPVDLAAVRAKREGGK